MRRHIVLAMAALATSIVLTGCGDAGTTSATSASSDSPRPTADPPELFAGFAESDLEGLLPPVTLLEGRWGTELDAETVIDLSQLWEGKKPGELHLAGFRTRKFLESGATPGDATATPSGGYVALTLFTTTKDAKAFTATIPLFRAEGLPDSDSYGQPIDLRAFADEGLGYTYAEEAGDVFGVAYLRMDRLIIEIALLGQPEESYAADLQAVAGSIREAVDQTSG